MDGPYNVPPGTGPKSMVVSNNGWLPGHVAAGVPLLAPTHKGGGGGGCQALSPTSGVAQSSGVVAEPL